MSNRCPVCLQPIPAGVSQAAIQARIQKLASPALESERKKLRQEFAMKLDAAQEAAQQQLDRKLRLEIRAAEARAKADAERRVKSQLAEAEKRASQAEDRTRREVSQARKEEQTRLRAESALAVKHAEKRAEERNSGALEKVQIQREKERIRYEGTVGSLQGKLEDLTRKLEMRSGEQFGAEAELDLYTELRRAFPEDHIDRISRGVKGADIQHKVIDGARVAGIIIYESKNTSTWQKSFIAQAKKYRTQYATPHVMIVSRAFPSKRKGLCVDCGVPIVESRMAISLAAIIREGVVAIGKLKLAGTFNAAKSQELYEYIVSDNFCTHFREIADQVNLLRDGQLKEKASHERMWQEESKIHERIQGSHRRVDAQINAIVRSSSSNGKSVSVAEMRRQSLNGETYIA